MNKRKSLGRGLDALLSSATVAGGARSADPPPAGPAPAPPPARESGLREVPVDLLQRGKYQPRVDMREETLAELAESIKAQGVVQPIVVRPLPNPGGGETRYEIVAGERRWRAAQLAGLHSIPAVVRDIPDEAAVAVALIENIQREDLNPLEEARSLHRLVEEFGLTHADAAEAVGRSRVTVSNLLRLLELPRPVRELLEQRQLDMGHARALLGLGSPEQQVEVARADREAGLERARNRGRGPPRRGSARELEAGEDGARRRSERAAARGGPRGDARRRGDHRARARKAAAS